MEDEFGRRQQSHRPDTPRLRHLPAKRPQLPALPPPISPPPPCCRWQHLSSCAPPRTRLPSLLHCWVIRFADYPPVRKATRKAPVTWRVSAYSLWHLVQPPCHPAAYFTGTHELMLRHLVMRALQRTPQSTPPLNCRQVGPVCSWLATQFCRAHTVAVVGAAQTTLYPSRCPTARAGSALSRRPCAAAPPGAHFQRRCLAEQHPGAP